MYKLGYLTCRESSQHTVNDDTISSLGTAVLQMANLGSQGVNGQYGTTSLPYSSQFTSLLKAMLAKNETERPNLECIRSSAASLCVQDRDSQYPILHQNTAAFASSLVYIETTQIRLLGIFTQVSTVFRLNSPITVDGGSRYIWANRDLFCSGGRAMQAGKPGEKPIYCY